MKEMSHPSAKDASSPKKKKKIRYKVTNNNQRRGILDRPGALVAGKNDEFHKKAICSPPYACIRFISIETTKLHGILLQVLLCFHSMTSPAKATTTAKALLPLKMLGVSTLPPAFLEEPPVPHF